MSAPETLPALPQPQILQARTLCATPPDCLSALDLAALLSVAQFLPAYLERCEDEAKKRLAAGDEVPGWELTPGQKRTAIHDTAKAWRRLASLLHEEEFLACCTVGVGKITEAIQKAEGVTEAQAKDILADYLRHDSNLVTSTGAPRLAGKPTSAQVAEIKTLEP